jgi:hypothetical protein
MSFIPATISTTTSGADDTKRVKERVQNEASMNSTPASTTTSSTDDTKRAKERVQNEVSYEERRHDTLARLLASKSICVAVAILNDNSGPTLYVSSNELYVSSKKNTKSTSIDNILKYFSTLGLPGAPVPTITDMQATFSQHIATAFRLNELLQGAPLRVSDAVFEEVIDFLATPRERRGGIHKYISNHENPSAAGLTYGTFSRPWKDWRRMTTLLTDAPPDIKASELRQVLKSNYRILNNGSNKVHAEARVVGEIIERRYQQLLLIGKEGLKPLTVYIGISKLCCLACNILIETANTISEKYGMKLTIKVRGAHNLPNKLKNGKIDWEIPKIFKNGFKQGFTKTVTLHNDNTSTTLFYDIGFLSGQKLKTALKEEEKQSNSKKDNAFVSMIPDRSDSDTDSIGGEGPSALQSQTLQHLKRIELFLQTESSSDLSVKEHLEKLLQKITQAKSLCNTPTYIDIIAVKNSPIPSLADAKTSFGTLLIEMREIGALITRGQLVDLLQNPTLIDEKIVKHFSEFVAAENELITSSSSSSSSSKRDLLHPPLLLSSSHIGPRGSLSSMVAAPEAIPLESINSTSTANVLTTTTNSDEIKDGKKDGGSPPSVVIAPGRDLLGSASSTAVQAVATKPQTAPKTGARPNTRSNPSGASTHPSPSKKDGDKKPKKGGI